LTGQKDPTHSSFSENTSSLISTQKHAANHARSRLESDPDGGDNRRDNSRAKNPHKPTRFPDRKIQTVQGEVEE
jgi:hypothetical protein